MSNLPELYVILEKRGDKPEPTPLEMLEAFKEIIKPIHLFQIQRRRLPFIADGDVAYTIPAEYVRKFSALYLNLEKYLQSRKEKT
jgi:hypothetical protein